MSTIRTLYGSIFVVFVILMMIYVVYGSKHIVDGFEDAKRCGVDLPSCTGEHVRCINGYCKSDMVPTAKPTA